MQDKCTSKGFSLHANVEVSAMFKAYKEVRKQSLACKSQSPLSGIPIISGGCELSTEQSLPI